MKNLTQALQTKLEGAQRVALLGVGSDLRGDDAAGILVANLLLKRFKKTPHFKVLIGETAPENFTGEVRKFKATHLIIVDSADMGEKPGTARLIDPDQIGGLSFCTHSLPLKVMTDYLKKDVGCQTIIIGIQPRNIRFGMSVSKGVLKTVQDVSLVIKEVVSALPRRY